MQSRQQSGDSFCCSALTVAFLITVRVRQGINTIMSVCRRLTQTASSDHVWGDGPELPLGFNVLQQPLVEALGTWRMGFELTGGDLPRQKERRDCSSIIKILVLIRHHASLEEPSEG